MPVETKCTCGVGHICDGYRGHNASECPDNCPIHSNKPQPQPSDEREQLVATIRELDAYKQGIISQLIVAGVYVREHDTDPHKAMHDFALMSQGVGEYFQKQEDDIRIRALESELQSAKNRIRDLEICCVVGS